MFPDGGDDFLFGDALTMEVRRDQLAVLDEDDGDAFDELTNSHASKPESSNASIDREQGGRRDESSLEAGVGPTMAFCTALATRRMTTRSNG